MELLNFEFLTKATLPVDSNVVGDEFVLWSKVEVEGKSEEVDAVEGESVGDRVELSSRILKKEGSCNLSLIQKIGSMQGNNLIMMKSSLPYERTLRQELNHVVLW